MVDIEKVKKGIKCCSAANADRVCFESECPYKNQDPRSEKCCIDEMLDNGLEAIEQLEKTVEDHAKRIAIMSEGGWRDAEKDQPKETDCYIVRIDYGVGQMTTMREYVSSEGKWLKSIEENITHWMQLPEPPKEVDAE